MFRAECRRWLGLHRSTLRYLLRPLPDKNKLLEAEIVEISKKYAYLGYRKITRKLIEQGWTVGKKLVQRVRARRA